MSDEIDGRIAFVKHCTETIRSDSFKNGYAQGMLDRKLQIIGIIEPLLIRDSTLQKLLKTIEDLE